MTDPVASERGRGTETGNRSKSVVGSPSSLANTNGGPTTDRGQAKRFNSRHSSPLARRRGPVTRHSIEVHIEELVLDGFDPKDRHRIGDAVERELARLIVAEGWSPSLMEPVQIDQLDGGTFRATPGGKAEALGTQVGQALFGQLEIAGYRPSKASDPTESSRKGLSFE